MLWVFPFPLNLCRYEAVFYSALALVLMSWILFENALLHLGTGKRLSTYSTNMEGLIILENDNRYLQLSDVRIPLIFVSFFFSFLFPFFPFLFPSLSISLQIMNFSHAWFPLGYHDKCMK